ncbi:MAG: efflux RND transporter permease subunit, partial [Elusimicrobiota bacterium]|nr:efflux RND transporter permease subunit [Elusimicrobiota bacterium]
MNLNFAKVSIKRPTFILSLLSVLIILGIAAYRQMSLAMYPDVEIPYVSVTIEYDGADPEEVEELITRPIEDAISSVAGLAHLYSISEQSYSVVFGQFDLDVNPETALADVRDAVSRAQKQLPTSGVDPAVIEQLDPNSMPISTISLKSETMTPKELYTFANNTVSLDLSRVNGVARVDIVGGVVREIHINVDRDKLYDYRLTLSRIASNIASNSLNVPVGDIPQGPVELTFRSLGQFKSLDDISNTIVNFSGNDIPVTVKDLGVVVDDVQKEQNRVRISERENGQMKTSSGVLLRVYKQSKYNEVKLADDIQSKVRELNTKYSLMSAKPSMSVLTDNASMVRLMLGDTRQTIFLGIILAVLVVYFFLGSWRSTFITALALPNSLIGAFVFMYVFGFSINVISLMAISLAVGLLIDDAIVVRENIYRHYQEGKTPIRAAIDGTNEVTMAVIATTSAVISVFLPISFMSGMVGKMFMEFGLTVVFVMIISILDALTIAPMLSAYIINDHDKGKKISPAQQKAVAFIHKLTLDWFSKVYSAVDNFYIAAVRLVLRHKLKTILITALVFTAALLIAFRLKVNFMPNINLGQFYISIQAEAGADLDATDKYASEVEAILLNDPNVDFSFTTVGNSKAQYNQASIYVRMVDKPTMTTEDFQNLIRSKMAGKLGNASMSFATSVGLSGGQSQVMYNLVGDTQSKLAEVESVLIERFRQIPSFVDLNTNYMQGNPEFQINFNFEQMNKLGINSVTAGNELRSMVAGNIAAQYR